ncbi:hypothetical protein LCGC14_2309040, partial [marine sediment metagenome]
RSTGATGEDADDGIAVGETGGIDFDLLHIKKGHIGDIGASGERLHTSASKIIIEGSGTYYIEVSESIVSADQAIPLIIVNNKAATVYLTSNRNDGSYCCEFTQVIVLAGIVHIGDSNIDTAVQTLIISPRGNRAALVNVIIHEDCERFKATTYKMSIYMSNGSCTMDSGALLIDLRRGTFTYGTDLAGSPETGLDIETLRMYGGTFYWNPDDSGDDAYIDNAYLFGGAFNAAETINNDRAKTLGKDGNSEIFVFEGAVLDIANGKGNITIFAGAALWNYGGVITVDNHTQLGISYDTY